jgi:hypothetical protein
MAAKVSAESVARWAEEVVGMPLAAEQREAVAGLLQRLFADMEAFRKVNVRDAEPAAVYDAGEVDS